MPNAERSPVLLYDGECELCRRALARLQAWDKEHRIAAVAYQDRAAVERLTRRFPAIPDLPELAGAMHVVLPDGRVYAGADAVPELLRVLPGKRWLRWGFHVPGIPLLARRVYRFVAERRHCVVRGTQNRFGRRTP